MRWMHVVGNNYILNKMKPIGPTLAIIDVVLVVYAAGISRGVWQVKLRTEQVRAGVVWRCGAFPAESPITFRRWLNDGRHGGSGNPAVDVHVAERQILRSILEVLSHEVRRMGALMRMAGSRLRFRIWSYIFVDLINWIKLIRCHQWCQKSPFSSSQRFRFPGFSSIFLIFITGRNFLTLSLTRSVCQSPLKDASLEDIPLGWW